MTMQRPVVVIGAGPAGAAAAEAAAESGPAVLLDERNRPLNLPGGIDDRPGTAVWGLFPGPVVAAYNAERAVEIDASAVVVATGGVDRVWPVAGWHRPGVVTASEIVAGALRYGVIGSGGNAGEAVAAIESACGTVEVVTGDLMTARIAGNDAVASLNGVPVDRVVLALGRLPDARLALQARVASAFDRRGLIERPLLAPDGATSLAGVYVAGEAAGMTGDDAARVHGDRAGRAAARVAAGGDQSTDLAAPAELDIPPLPLPTDPATVIDRHQGVDLATLRAAIADGAFDVNDLRRRTRAGMGAGGEILPVLAALLLEVDPGVSDDRLIARVRPPLRPLPFRAVLAGEHAS